MHDALNRNLFLVKEHVGMFKAANNYDIYDPDTGDIILLCREQGLGQLTRLLRFTDWKRRTPFDLHVTTPENEQLVRVKRGWSFWLSKVDVLDGNNRAAGCFAQKLFSVGGAFDVLGTNDEVLCSLKGKWTSWDFRFIAGDKEFARVTKKWAGLGKEMFTSADNYILEIAESVPADSRLRILILAAVLCIDMVLKE